jgi:hypothetical protein
MQFNERRFFFWFKLGRGERGNESVFTETTKPKIKQGCIGSGAPLCTTSRPQQFLDLRERCAHQFQEQLKWVWCQERPLQQEQRIHRDAATQQTKDFDMATLLARKLQVLLVALGGERIRTSKRESARVSDQ